mgnify:CR=1 FL=1
MQICWNEDKRQVVLKGRGIDFADLESLLSLPYLEDQRRDEPEQYRIIGFTRGKLISFIVEYREEDLEEFIWVVTAWNSTTQEERAYEQEIGQWPR